MKIKNQYGSSLVEFLIVFPALILVVFGVIEFSVLFYDYAIIYNASRNGARYGVVVRSSPSSSSSSSYATPAEVINYTQTYCTGKLLTFSTTAVSATITATQSANPPTRGSLLTVTVSYPYSYLLVHKLVGFNQQNTLTTTTVMTYE